CRTLPDAHQKERVTMSLQLASSAPSGPPHFPKLSPAQSALVETHRPQVMELLNDRFLRRSVRKLDEGEALSVAHDALGEAALQHDHGADDFAEVAERAVRRAVRGGHRSEDGRPDRARGEGDRPREGGVAGEDKVAAARWRRASVRSWREARRRAAVAEKFR